MATIGVIDIAMRASTGQLVKGLQSASSAVSRFGGSVRSGVSGALTQFAKLGLAVTGVQTLITGVVGAVSKPLTLAAEAEKTAVSFGVLLGSGEKAKTVLDDLRKFGAETPFEFPELADAGKKLIAFGYSADDLVPKMRQLGDISAGLGIPFAELADVVGKMKVQGKLMGEDLNQLMGRGIPIVSELAKVFGVSNDEIKKMTEQGLIKFEHLQMVLDNLTGSGGKFSGMMAQQSQTLGGIWSTLKDNVGMALTKLGDTIVKTFNLKETASGLIKWMEEIQPQIDSWLAWFTAGFEQVKPIILQWTNVLISYITMLGDVIGSVFSWISGMLGNSLGGWQQFRDFVLTALISLEFGFQNWQKVGELSFKWLGLQVVAFGNTVVYWFTDVVPGVLLWFADNWREIFHDIGETALTVFKNLGSNIIMLLSNLPELIRGELSFDDLWTPLLEGAEYQLSKLPEIPPRVMGEFEKALSDDVEGLKTELGSSWEQFREQRFNELLPPAIQKLEEKSAEMEKATAAAQKTAEKPTSKKDELKLAGLAEFGSKEARDAIFRNRFSQTDKQAAPLNAINKTTADQLAEQKQHTLLLQSLNMKISEMETLDF